jgi:hypothetical protein
MSLFVLIMFTESLTTLNASLSSDESTTIEYEERADFLDEFLYSPEIKDRITEDGLEFKNSSSGSMKERWSNESV